MDKIVYYTTSRVIGVDQLLKPETPLWSIINTGFVNVFVNGLLLGYNQRFGVDDY